MYIGVGEVGDNEAADIDKVISKILYDLGNPEPPIVLDHVRELLKLDLQYYNTADHKALDQVVHQIKLAGKQIVARPMLLIEAIRKANISALWIPDSKRILIDQHVPHKKQRWVEAHEIGHSVIPWHRDYLFGDNELTLDPACHAIVEAEANFGAGRLLFMQDRFLSEARAVAFSFANIKKLATRYNNTITTTLWRFVVDVEPRHPIFGMISNHPNRSDIKIDGITDNWKHYIYSQAFIRKFGHVKAAQVFSLIRENANSNRGGTVVDAICDIKCTDGKAHKFRIESFCNQHALLTYGIQIK